MTVRIRLFAILRERAGCDWVDVDLEDDATVADALRALRQHSPLGELLGRLSVRMAVNRDFAQPETRLAPDDELALIPPISGGAEDIHVRISDQPLSLEAVARSVSRPGAGAVAIFQGVTREVQQLEYEAYREMATERIALIMRECLERHGLQGCAAEHRVGGVARGEPSVIVAVSAAHRAEAFAGAREAIDRIKAEAPIWKREVSSDGHAVWAEGTPVADALSHVDRQGRAQMVDVGAKAVTERVARAGARVLMAPATALTVATGDAPKGEVLGTARLAGIQAAKSAASLIPLAHPLALTFVDVAATVRSAVGLVELTSEARTVGRTGVEMEAMTACTVAALTVYDMVKGIERGVRIERVMLLEKTGGRADWRYAEDSERRASDEASRARAES